MSGEGVVPGKGTKQPANARERWESVLWKLGTLGIIGVVFLVWELLPALGLVNEILLPRFSNVLRALGRLLTNPTFYTNHFLVTMIEVVVAFCIAVVIGFFMGVLLALFMPVRRLFFPLVIAFQSFPTIVIAPLIIAWLGYGIESKIGFAVTSAFFPVLLNTLLGLSTAPADGRRLMYSLQASRVQTFLKFDLPHATPTISVGIQNGLTLAFMSAVVAEFLGAQQGLGFLVASYAFQLRIDATFAVIIVLAVVGSSIFLSIGWLTRRIVFWHDNL